MSIEENLAEFISRIKYEDIPENVKHEVKRRFIDTLGVAYSSMDNEAANRIKKMAPLYPGNARMIGMDKASPDFSAFFNSLIIRYMDFNDTYLSLEPLHPSDMFGPLITLGSMFHKTGKDIIAAVAVGYEIGMRLCDSASLRKKGYDHVNYTQIAMASALSNMMNFNVAQTINAISIALVPHIALRQTRVGELSMWKAGAAANSARNAVFSAISTLYGFTSAKEPISGKLGFKNIVVPDMDLSKLEGKTIDGIMRTYIKKYPVEYHAQAAVEASLKLSNEIDVNNIESINVLALINGVFPNSVMFASNGESTLFETYLNSSSVDKASGNIISAPSSMNNFALSTVSSIPLTALASVLAIISEFFSCRIC